MEARTCTHCKQEKDITHFYRDYSIIHSIAFRAKCKECIKTLSKSRKQHEKKDITEKICVCCNKKLTISNFFKSTRHLDGFFAHCKACHEIKLENIGYNVKIKRTPEYMKQYWKDKLQNIQYRMKQNIKRYLSQRMTNKKQYKTTKYIGCSIEFFIKWLEYRFTIDMNWENYSSYWEMDHVRPCASFDFTKDRDVMTCFNWQNYQPLHKDENRKKSNIIYEKYFEDQNRAIKNFISIYKNEIQCTNNYYSLI